MNAITKLKEVTPAILSIVVTIGFFVICIVLLFDDKQSMLNSSPILQLLGSLTTAWASVMGFWFGSTASSAKKTELIANSTPNNILQK